MPRWRPPHESSSRCVIRTDGRASAAAASDWEIRGDKGCKLVNTLQAVVVAIALLLLLLLVVVVLLLLLLLLL